MFFVERVEQGEIEMDTDERYLVIPCCKEEKVQMLRRVKGLRCVCGWHFYNCTSVLPSLREHIFLYGSGHSL